MDICNSHAHETEWVYPTLTNGTTSETNLGGRLRYRVIGNHVFVSGGLTITYSGSSKVIFTLPANCKPRANPYFLCPTGGTRVARVYVAKENGSVVVEWIRNISDGSNYTSSTWVILNIDFWAD